MPTKGKLEELREMIASMERTLFAARTIVAELAGDKPLLSQDSFLQKQVSSASIDNNDEGKIIEGVFDGQGMKGGDGDTYPVPANYASKSKIVVGDKMKLTITREGKFVYKQIGPTERKNIIGPLTCEDGQYKVLANGKEYKVLMASITFHKASVGDEVSILIPEEGEALWGALDAVIPTAEL